MDHTSAVDHWFLWKDGSLFKAPGTNEQGKKKNNNNTKPKQNVKNTATNYSSEVKNEKISLGTAIKMSIYEGKGGGKSSILLVYILITLGFLY